MPRPETELLLEQAIALWRTSLKPHQGAVLDLCCGSGVVAVVLARELGVPVVAVDISGAAIAVARKNAAFHGVSHLVSFIQADLLSAFRMSPLFSLVVSNPPYVSRGALADGLQPEVGEHEPHLALDGGKRGLEIIKRIRRQLPMCLYPKAELLMEIGAEQGGQVCDLFAEGDGGNRFSRMAVTKDYGGHDRIFSAAWAE